MFYEGEGKFVELAGGHFRGIATVAATELGFMVTALTLVGVNEKAKYFVGQHIPEMQLMAILLFVGLMVGSLQGYLMALAMQALRLSAFIPNQIRVLVSKTAIEEERARKILEDTDQNAKKNEKAYERYTNLHLLCGRVATVGFLAANAIAVWLIFKLN